jgi:hypothetical protein
VFNKHVLDEHQMGFAAGELVAHVNYMIVEGRLTAETGDGVLQFRTASLHLAPLAGRCRSRSDRVRGLSASPTLIVLAEAAPHPNPLSASEARRVLVRTGRGSAPSAQRTSLHIHIRDRVQGRDVAERA